MKNYLSIFLIVLILGVLGFFGYKYREQILGLGNLFNKVDISKLQEDNKKLEEDIRLISLERDLLKPQIEKFQLMNDSLAKVDSLNRIDLLKIREENKILEKRLSSSKDSVKKYKSVWNENVKKYNKIKKNQKKPSNQQTLEFFKKY